MKTSRHLFLLALSFSWQTVHGDEVTVSSLRESLDSQVVETRRAAALKLGSLKQLADPAFPDLAQATKDEDPVVAARAVQALTQNRSNRDGVVGVWLEALESPHASVRIAAAESIGRTRPRQIEAILGRLIQALEDDNPLVAVAVSNALARLDFRKYPEGKEQLVKAAKPLLQSEDSRIQSAGAGMLAWQKAGVEEALPILTHLLKSPSRRVRRDSIGSIQRFGPLAIAAVPAVLENLESLDEVDRQYAGRALLSIDPENAVTTLSEILQQSRVQLAREGAVRALALVDSEPARNAVANALRDRSANVRYFACHAILRSGKAGESAAENLRYILSKDRNSIVKELAGEALGILGQ